MKRRFGIIGFLLAFAVPVVGDEPRANREPLSSDDRLLIMHPRAETAAMPLAPELLRAGDSVVLVRSGDTAIALLDSDDPTIRFKEAAGGVVVIRLSIDDASRLVTLTPSEARDVRLRDEFTDATLSKTHLQVEVLQGDGGVVMQTTELLPQTQTTMRRRAVHPPNAQPTSFALIDQAEASGTINSETALLYRVYSLFSDARLPAQYRGDDKGIIDSIYLAEVVRQYPTLSPSIRNAVRPFLVPPAYQGSWVNAKSGSPTAVPANPLTPCEAPFFSDKWDFVDASSPVRVFYRRDLTGDQAYATGLAAEIDSRIWPTLVNVMYPGDGGMSFPLSDESHPCNGGNGRLDIYLIDGNRSATIPYEFCNPTPSFIALVRGSDAGLAAHEIFHSIEASFPVRGCGMWLDARWWAEASAEWAIDFVYKKEQPHQIEQGTAYDFLEYPKLPLDYANDKHEYGAYLLPFFVYHSTGSADFMRQSWKNLATDHPLDAVDQAIGGFEKMWPEFVKHNWNEPPVDDYQKWDDQILGAYPEEGGPLPVGVATPDFSISLPYDLPRVSAIYHHLTFDNQVSSVIFWNGVTHKLSLFDSDCCGKVYAPEPFTGDAKKGARVQALIKIDGQDWQIADWTDRPFVAFCRDVLAERIDELVLIISNSEKDLFRTLKPVDLAPVLWTSNMGCFKWEGKSTHTEERTDLDSTVTVSANVTWTRADMQPNPSLTLYHAEGTQSWKVTGQCSGSGTSLIDSTFSALLTFNYIPAESAFNRAYAGEGDDSGPDVTVGCGERGPATISLPDWFVPPPPPVVPGIPRARIVKVKASGKVIDDADTPSERETTSWHFEARRQQ
jgi:hypothetical protein